MKPCPKCNLTWPESQATCDCGYSFLGAPSAPVSFADRSAPHLQSQAAPPSKQTSVGFRWDRIIQIWWSIVWRQTVFGLVAGAALGFIGGFLAAIAGRADLATLVGVIFAWLGSIPLSVVVLRIALKKKYEDFSLKIVED